MPLSRFRFRFSQPARLATLRATLRLLYTSHPRAFVTSSIASLFEPLFYPALLLLLHQLLQEVIGSGSTVRFTSTVAFIGLGLVLSSWCNAWASSCEPAPRLSCASRPGW